MWYSYHYYFRSGAAIRGKMVQNNVHTSRCQSGIFTSPSAPGQWTCGKRGKTINLSTQDNARGKNFNWVEALPCALKCIHDQPGIGGLSPYHISFGRERPLDGIGWNTPTNHWDANKFFDHIESVDQQVAATINAKHHQIQETQNKVIRKRPQFDIGDKVLHIKPGQLGGHKSKHSGQAHGKSWVEEGTIARDGGQREVHISQLKLYLEDPVLGDGYPYIISTQATNHTP